MCLSSQSEVCLKTYAVNMCKGHCWNIVINDFDYYPILGWNHKIVFVTTLNRNLNFMYNLREMTASTSVVFQDHYLRFRGRGRSGPQSTWSDPTATGDPLWSEPPHSLSRETSTFGSTCLARVQWNGDIDPTIPG